MNFLPAYVIRCYFYFYYVLDLAPLYSTIGIKVFLSLALEKFANDALGLHMSCWREDYICEVTREFPPALQA